MSGMTVLVDQKLNKHRKDNTVLIFILCILNVWRTVQTCAVEIDGSTVKYRVLHSRVLQT